MQHQDWKPVVMRKVTPQQQREQREAQLRVSKRSKKVDDNPDQFSHAKMTKTMAQQISKARVKRGLSQKALALQLSLPLKTIQTYETGKAIPKGTHLALLNRALGIRIVRHDKRMKKGAQAEDV